MPQSVCLTTAVARSAPSSPTRGRRRAGASCPRSVSSPCTLSAVGASSTSVERNVIGLALEHLVVDRLLDVRPCRRRRATACRRCPRARAATRRRRSSSTRVRGSSPTASVASQAVTWMSRSWPALAAAPVRPVRTERVPSSGPSLYVPACKLTRRPYAILRLARPRTPYRRPPMAVELDHSFTTSKPTRRELRRHHRPRARGAVRPGRQRARDDGSGRREGRDPGQDGRDVDEVHRHGRGHREGRGRPPRGADGQVARGRRAGPRQRDGHLRARRRRRERSTPTPRSPARRRRWARASSPACSTR